MNQMESASDASQLSFRGRSPASPAASNAARCASRKTGTRCELELRRALWKFGFRYRKNYDGLPGKPDIAFISPRVVVFCDGDFWHGRDWPSRRAKLLKGNNGDYWCAKIERNIQRDQQITARLEADGWVVLRFWESEIRRDPSSVVATIEDAVRERRD